MVMPLIWLLGAILFAQRLYANAALRRERELERVLERLAEKIDEADDL